MQPDRVLWRARCIERCTPGSGSGPGKRNNPDGLSPRPGPTFTDRQHKKPPTQEIVDFIDANRADLGVEPICTVLRNAGVQVAPSTYYAAKNRQPSAREQRDAEMIPVLVRIWEDNYRVYGVLKLWKAARRAGHDIGRDQTARLMGRAGIAGARRGKKVRTTRPDLAATRHPDLVGRDFTATAPNQLWVVDLTFVATWAGVA